MKLWEKNYLLTMIFIFVVLFSSTSFILQYSFRENLTRYCENSILMEHQLKYALSDLLYENTIKLRLYCQALAEQDIYICVNTSDSILVDYLAFPYISDKKYDFNIVKKNDFHYICISDSFLYSEDIVFITSMENITELYKNQKKQLWLLLSISLFLSLILAFLLYHIMKKLYYPINNIAHELRTPLTTIQGYAQYILFGKISEEDILDPAMLKILNGNHDIPKDKIYGKGLGVSLCHDMIKLHHGKLTYENIKNGGIKITITF